MTHTQVWIAIVISMGLAQAATAEMVEKTGRFSGVQVTYKVVLPTGYLKNSLPPQSAHSQLHHWQHALQQKKHLLKL